MMKKLFFLLLAFGSLLTLSAQTYRPCVSVLGDSYSTFHDYPHPSTTALWYFHKPQNTDVNAVNQMWWHQLISGMGWRLCRNNSYSGATISYTGYSGNDYSDRSFITRMDDLGCPDIIFVFGATNDSWAGSPVGDYKWDNFNRSDFYSFRPAMAYMLEHMTLRYPNVKIYFILNDGLKPSINESAETICKHYGVELIKLSGIDKQSGHPTVKGQKQIADQLMARLKK